jgi:hypothetical protein
MLKQTGKIFSIGPIVEQVSALSFEKRLPLNEPNGTFFSDPWKVKDEYANTPLGNVLDSLGPIGEARLLKLASAETYTAHADPDDRYHLAIVTNPYACIINLDNGTTHHLPVDGEVWFMDTGFVHIAANFGGRERIHLNVRVLLPKYDPMQQGLRLGIKDGDFDWKQESYIEVMPFINRQIKLGNITGFDRIDDREFVVNVTDSNLLDEVVLRLQQKGFRVILDRI